MAWLRSANRVYHGTKKNRKKVRNNRDRRFSTWHTSTNDQYIGLKQKQSNISYICLIIHVEAMCFWKSNHFLSIPLPFTHTNTGICVCEIRHILSHWIWWWYLYNSTAQAPLATEGWPSGKQLLAIDNLAALPTAVDRRQLNSIQLGSNAACLFKAKGSNLCGVVAETQTVTRESWKFNSVSETVVRDAHVAAKRQASLKPTLPHLGRWAAWQY